MQVKLGVRLTEEKAKVLLDLVIHLAAFHETDASKYLRQTGSYGMFDEPGTVRKTRAVLKDLELYP